MDLISRQAAIDAVEHDAYRHTYIDQITDIIRCVPPAEPTLCGYNIKHLELIATILQKEGLSPDSVVEALTNIGRIIDIVQEEFVERLQEVVNK